MKKLFVITLTIASLSVFAQPASPSIGNASSALEPVKVETQPSTMKLAKKKDHSKDKKIAAIRRPKKLHANK